MAENAQEQEVQQEKITKIQIVLVQLSCSPQQPKFIDIAVMEVSERLTVGQLRFQVRRLLVEKSYAQVQTSFCMYKEMARRQVSCRGQSIPGARSIALVILTLERIHARVGPPAGKRCGGETAEGPRHFVAVAG